MSILRVKYPIFRGEMYSRNRHRIAPTIDNLARYLNPLYPWVSMTEFRQQLPKTEALQAP